MADKSITQSIRDLQARMGQTPAGSLWDAVREGLADAITDIRQKVVEEPWFGRAVTPELVKEVDPAAGGIHGTQEARAPGPEDAVSGGVHGKAEPGPKPDTPGLARPGIEPEKSAVYREKVEQLFERESRPGQSFAEAVSERYGWGKDFWPMQKDIAEHAPGKEMAKEPDQGVER